MPCWSTALAVSTYRRFARHRIAPRVVACALCLGVTVSHAVGKADPPALRIGMHPSALPQHTGDRDYTASSLAPLFVEQLAHTLGRSAQWVPLAPAEAPQALAQGRVDVVLLHLPRGHELGPSVRTLSTGLDGQLGTVMRADSPLRHWSDVRGRTLCTTQNHPTALAHITALGGRVQTYPAAAQALARVRTGACDAAVLDDMQLRPLRQRADWAKFSAALPVTQGWPLVAALSAQQAGLTSAVRTAIADLGHPRQWAQRGERWAAQVAFEVFFDHIGPDCH